MPAKKVESVNILQDRFNADALECKICMEKLSMFMVCKGRYFFIQCPHCLSCQHISCVRPYARSAGESHLMCPDCQCSKLDAKMDDTPAKIKQKIKCQQQYVDYCRRYGVYVPVKDAAWEEDESYFEDQKAEYGQCDQDPCSCPDGNKHDDWDPVTKDKTGKWYIVLCSACAGSGSHRECGGIAVGQQWLCDICKTVIQKDKSDEDGNVDNENNEDDEIIVNLDDDSDSDEDSHQGAGAASAEATPAGPQSSESTESMLDLVAEGEKRKLEAAAGGDEPDEPVRKKSKSSD